MRPLPNFQFSIFNFQFAADDVAQVFNLPYRRFSTCRAPEPAQIANHFFNPCCRHLLQECLSETASATEAARSQKPRRGDLLIARAALLSILVFLFFGGAHSPVRQLGTYRCAAEKQKNKGERNAAVTINRSPLTGFSSRTRSTPGPSAFYRPLCGQSISFQ